MPGVYFNTQVPARLAVLAFLGTVAALAVVVLIIMVLLFRRRLRLAGLIALLAAGGVGLYLTALLLFSFSSRELAARPGEEKYFCELDCHLAYSVAEVARTSTLGPSGAQCQARGTFVVVRLKVRFDEQTIASWRPRDLPLRPNRRAVALVDAAGRRYSVSKEGLQALVAAEGSLPSLDAALLPGESYTATLVFDLPAEAGEVRLLLTEADWVTSLLIGHENSFLHKKTYFLLTENPAGAPLA